MSDENDNSGAGDGTNGHSDQPQGVVPPMSPEDLQMLLLQQFEVLAHEIAGITKLFAPHLTDDDIWKLAQSVAKEQLDQKQGLPLVLNGMTDPTAVQVYPTLHLYFTFQGKRVEMQAPKRLDGIADPIAAGQSAVMLAFLLAPGARAVLRAYGFQYHFAQSKKPVSGKIITL